LPLLGVLALFNIDLFGSGPLITIDLPARMLETRSAGGSMLTAKTPLWFPIHSTGEWAIRWLVVSLTITPLMILFGFKRLRRYRKLFGLYAFGYSVLHFLFFIADKNLWQVFDEYNYIIGLISFLILALLAATSNNWSIRELRGTWKSLHKWAYAAGVLAVVHLIFLEKDSWIVYAVVLGIGFLIRLYSVRLNGRLGPRSAPNLMK
jgi:sulfoxide reductase heme-binding subunit YedZ